MSPRTSKQNEEIREQSREKIMMVALELFAKNGFHSTSIKKIADKAKVAKGLVNYYFKTKEELLNAVINKAMTQGDNLVETVMAISDPKERLKFIFDISFKWMNEHFEYSKLLTSLSLQLEQFPSLVQQVHAKYKGMIPLMEQMLKDIGIEDYKAEAKMLAALMDGIGLQYIVLHDEYPVEEMKGYLYQRYGIDG